MQQIGHTIPYHTKPLLGLPNSLPGIVSEENIWNRNSPKNARTTVADHYFSAEAAVFLES